MEDIKTLFEVNKRDRVEVVTTGDRGFTGIVEDVQDNHVAIKENEEVYYIFYRQIVYVRLV